MPELYRRPLQRKPAGMSIARMVAVAKAQTRSDPAFCEITSTLTTPMVEPGLDGFGRAMISSPSAGAEEIDLDLDGDARACPSGSDEWRAGAGSMVGERGDDAAMEMAEELRQLRPLRERHRHLARLG